MVDPLSMLVAAWVVAVFVTTRLPEVLTEAEFIKRGEQSPTAAAHTRRLIDAEIDPATGGALRQYVGNAWRNAWLDLDERQARRKARSLDDPAGSTLFQRLEDRFADAIAHRLRGWRTQAAEHQPPPTVDVDDLPDNPEQAAPAPDRPPVVHNTDEYRLPPDTEPPVAGFGGTPDPPHTHPGPHFEPPASADPGEDRGPLKGTLARIQPPGDDPFPAPTASLMIEGAPSMSTSLVRAGSVTGVLSGAAEARAIARAIDAANDAYVSALTRARQRINNLGEQTLTQVQLAQRSNVVALTVQAAESAAAAQAAARTCGAEVGPILHQVARAFDRLNS